MGEYVTVAQAGEIQPEHSKLVEMQGKKIALFNIGGKLYALDNSCTHCGGPLSRGELEGDQVTCPWHGAKFRISSGEVLGPPARQGVRAYRIRLNGTSIQLEI